MKFLYIANIRLPTEKAHGIQIRNTCKALAAQGALEALWITDRRIGPTDAVLDDSGDVPIVRLAVPDIVSWGRIAFVIETLIFSLQVLKKLKALPGLSDARVLYGRDELVLCLLSYVRKEPIYWESHTGSWNLAAQLLAKRAAYIVTISEGLKDFYCEKGISTEKICVVHDGVDAEVFAGNLSPASAKAQYVPGAGDKKVALYAGRLDGWKGIDTLLGASLLLPDVQVVVVGGEASQVKTLAARYPNVTFLGFKSYEHLPDIQQAADVLVLPNTGKDTIARLYTSPLKLFTYMASGIPLVTSDLPSVREIVSEESANFFTPDDSVSLARSIQEALTSPEASQKAHRAQSLVKEYSWNARALRIVHCGDL